MSVHVDRRGYRYVTGETGRGLEHRIVLKQKIGGGEHPCHHCGATVSWDKKWPHHADALVVDHLDFNKGNNDPSNLVPSCTRCNSGRISTARRNAMRQEYGITYNGETLTAAEWARRIGISSVSLFRRIAAWGYTERTFTAPGKKHV